MTDKAKPDDPAQSRRFIDMAREIEGSEDQSIFDRVFEKVVHAVPPPIKPSEKK